MLPWCWLPGGRVLVSHLAGSEQGDEVKASNPQSPLRWVLGAPPGAALGRTVVCILLRVFIFLLQADPSLRSSPARPPHLSSTSH